VKVKVLHLMTFKEAAYCPRIMWSVGPNRFGFSDNPGNYPQVDKISQFYVIGIKKNSYAFENLSNVIDKPDEAQWAHQMATLRSSRRDFDLFLKLLLYLSIPSQRIAQILTRIRWIGHIWTN
jgi:hypothetical protein